MRYYLQHSNKTLAYKNMLLSRYIDIEDVLETDEFIRNKTKYPFIVLDPAARKKIEASQCTNEYIWIDDLLDCFDFSSLGKASERRIVIWGAGDSAKGILEKYTNLKVEYFVDRSIEKQEKGFLGHKVYAVDKIWHENKDEVFVLVAIHANYSSIKEELEKNGYTEHVNFASHKYYWCTPNEALERIHREFSGDYTLMFSSNPESSWHIGKDVVFDKNVLAEASSWLTKNHSYECVRIVDSRRKVLGYAYFAEIRVAFWLSMLLDDLLKQQFVSIFDVYPEWKGVILKGMDEYSVRMMWYCQKYGIPYYLDGDAWRSFGLLNEEVNKCLPGGDGWRSIVSGKLLDEQYGFLGKVMHRNYEEAQRQMGSFLKQNGIASYMVDFPTFQDIKEPTEEETWCFENGVDIFWEPRGEEWIRHLKLVASEEKIREVNSGRRERDRKVRNFSRFRTVQALNESREYTIYLMGPCVAIQLDHRTEDSIIGIWQNLVPDNYTVKAISVVEHEASAISKMIHMLDFKVGDIVIWARAKDGGSNTLEDCIDLTGLMNNRGRERWWTNIPIHLTELGSKRVAEYLFKKCIEPNLRRDSSEVVLWASTLDETEEKMIGDYVEKYRKFIKDGVCGAIVMNCNPYTRGHDYLIETALKQVDWLYVFVVEENKSFFSFEERYWMVKENTKRFHNVIVLPSGNMILSMMTLPAYFAKENNQELRVDGSTDLRFFSLGIAPHFHISKRFVGEEPFDNVTRQYNEGMKKMLPHYHMELIEVPRKKNSDGMVINATEVRRALQNNNAQSIETFVTDVTMKFLMVKFCQ